MQILEAETQGGRRKKGFPYYSETGARGHGHGDTKCRFRRPRPRAGGVRRDFRIIVKRVNWGHEAGMGTLSADFRSRELGREA